MKVTTVEKVNLVMAGWAQQFDNPPEWKPEVSEKDGILFLGDQPVCQASDVRTVSSDVDKLELFTEDCRYIVEIDWPFKGNPHFGAITRENYPC